MAVSLPTCLPQVVVTLSNSRITSDERVVKPPDSAEPPSEVGMRGNKTNKQTNKQRSGEEWSGEEPSVQERSGEEASRQEQSREERSVCVFNLSHKLSSASLMEGLILLGHKIYSPAVAV